jgi:hypothetical protein
MVLMVMALLVVGTASRAEALVLCANPSGSVFVRATCQSSEQTLDPLALGLQGPQGDPGTAGPTSLHRGNALIEVESTLLIHTVTADEGGLNTIVAVLTISDGTDLPAAGDETRVFCSILANDDFVTGRALVIRDIDQAGGEKDFTLLARETFAAGDVISVKCSALPGDENEAQGVVEMLLQRVAS